MLIGPLHFSHELALFLARSCTFLFAETPNVALMVFVLVVGLHQVKISVCGFMFSCFNAGGNLMKQKHTLQGFFFLQPCSHVAWRRPVCAANRIQ